MNLPSDQEIIEDLAFFDDWEQRYQYIIDLGKALTPFDEQQKRDEDLVPGCQSQVWLHTKVEQGRLQLFAYSDAIIVNGLLAIVLAAYHNKMASEILAFDIDSYFKTLDLERHISPTRGNGLRAIVGKIQQLARQQR